MKRSRELVRPNFLDLREFIIIFLLRNNRGFSPLPFAMPISPARSHARDESYNRNTLNNDENFSLLSFLS